MIKNAKIAGIGVNSDDYHSQAVENRGKPDFVMSPSSIKAFDSACPSRWKAGYQPPETEAKDWGQLLDTLALTPEQFDSKYVTKPETYKDAKTGEIKPWNGNSNVCKEWLSEHKEFSIVSPKDVLEAQAAVKRLTGDETIAEYLACSDKQVHVTAEWHDENGVIVPVQCLIDLVPRKDSPFCKSLGDLKSTRNAGQKAFSRWCYTAGYHIQAAFDLDLYQMATRTDPDKETSGEERMEWMFILSENYAPWEPGRRVLGQDLIEIGRATYRAALKRYARCVKTGKWPGYDKDEEFTVINAEPWMEYSALSDQLENQQAEELEQSDDVIP